MTVPDRESPVWAYAACDMEPKMYEYLIGWLFVATELDGKIPRAYYEVFDCGATYNVTNDEWELEYPSIGVGGLCIWAPNGTYQQLLKLLKNTMEDGPCYPFGGSAVYRAEIAQELAHKNQERITWVRNMLEAYHEAHIKR